MGGCYHFLCPLYQKELLKECFPQILMPPYSGSTGTDFSELGQSRAKRSDPCVREPVAGGDETTHTHPVTHTHLGLCGELLEEKREV